MHNKFKNVSIPVKEDQSSIVIFAFLTPILFWFAPLLGFLTAFVCSIVCGLMVKDKITLPEKIRIPANYLSSYITVILMMSIVSFVYHSGFLGEPMDTSTLNSQIDNQP